MNIIFLQETPLEEIFDGEMSGGALNWQMDGASNEQVPFDLLSNFADPFIGIFITLLLIFFAFYLYLSIVYSKIGSKAGLNSPQIAWFPLLGPISIIFESSKMHWWPFLIMVIGLLGGFILMLSGFIMGSVMLVLGLIIMFASQAVFMIMLVVWHWKTYEIVGKPGWWILIPVVSLILGFVLGFIGASMMSSAVSVIGTIIALLGTVAHLVLIGIAAWSGGPINE